MTTAHETLNELAGAGLTVPDGLRPAPVWRASSSSSGKLHTGPGCGCLRGRGRLTPADVFAAAPGDWCSSCQEASFAGEPGEWVGFARRVLQLHRALDAALPRRDTHHPRRAADRCRFRPPHPQLRPRRRRQTRHAPRRHRGAPGRATDLP